MKTLARIRATDAQIKALAAKGKAAAKEPHAIAVRFDSKRDRYVIELSTGGAFAVPRPRARCRRSSQCVLDVGLEPVVLYVETPHAARVHVAMSLSKVVRQDRDVFEGLPR